MTDKQSKTGKALSAYLRIVKHQRHLTHQKVENLIGWSQSTFSRLCCGQRQWTDGLLEDFGGLVGMTPPELLSAAWTEYEARH